MQSYPYFLRLYLFFLGNFIYYKNPNNRLNRLIALLCFLVAYLSFAEYGLRQAESILTAYYWSKATFLWPMLTPLLLNIVLIVTRKNDLLKNKVVIFLLVSTVHYTIHNKSFNQRYLRWCVA